MVASQRDSSPAGAPVQSCMDLEFEPHELEEVLPANVVAALRRATAAAMAAPRVTPKAWDVLEFLRDRQSDVPLSGQQLAAQLGVRFTGRFRETLSTLVELRRLLKRPGGYVLAPWAYDRSWYELTPKTQRILTANFIDRTPRGAVSGCDLLRYAGYPHDDSGGWNTIRELVKRGVLEDLGDQRGFRLIRAGWPVNPPAWPAYTPE